MGKVSKLGQQWKCMKVHGIRTNVLVSVSTHGPMEKSMKALGMKTNEVGRESSFGLAVKYIKVNGRMEKGLAKELKLCLQVQYIKAIGKTENDEDLVNKSGRAARSTKVTGFKTIELVMENRLYQMVQCMKVNG